MPELVILLLIESIHQVLDWVPLSKDLVVVYHGIVEMALGLTLLLWQRVNIDWPSDILYSWFSW
jgi:hypothetical protein